MMIKLIIQFTIIIYTFSNDLLQLSDFFLDSTFHERITVEGRFKNNCGISHKLMVDFKEISANLKDSMI